MGVFETFLAEYGPMLISTLVTAIAGYFGMVIKRLYEQTVTDRKKEAVVQTCVKAVEQLYHDLSGEEKLSHAMQSVTEMLSAHGITATELELRMLIESAVAEFNYNFSKKAA